MFACEIQEPVLVLFHARNSQKIKKKTKNLRVTDEGWNYQKQLSGPVEKRSRKRKLLYPHPKLSLGLVPYRP